MLQPNSLHDTALDHLRVIRTLMERASLYRAISAPAALIGGILSLVASIAGFCSAPAWDNLPFLAIWTGVLFLTTVVNVRLLMKEAGEKGQPRVTDGLLMALRAIVPPMLTGGVLGVCLILDGQRTIGVLVWILCYGLALQATVGFAPKSIIRLARAFLIAGQLTAVAYFASRSFKTCPDDWLLASALLGITFGGFHLAYGAAVFFSKPTSAGPAEQHDRALLN